MYPISFEYKADEYVVDQGQNIVSALIKLHAMHNIANIMPDELYSIYNYSHPSLLQRLNNIRQYAKKTT
jgi:STE24 endopeptidase